MKKKIALFSLMLLCLGIYSCSDKEEYNSFSTISGFVLEENTSEPIAGATLTVTPGGKSTTTGSDGFFEFTNMDAVQYNISVQKEGYVSNRKTVTGVAGETVHINITLSKREGR